MTETIVDIRAFGVDAASADNRAAFQAAFAEQNIAVIIPPGTYKIDGPIGWDVAADFRCMMDVRGHGRRITTISQQDETQPVFQLKTASGNIRDLTLSGLTLSGGIVGLDILNDEYCLFDNITFAKQTQHGLRVNNRGSATSEFRSFWFLYQWGNSLKVDIGAAWLTNPVFGEAGGAFDISSAALKLDNPTIFDCKNNLSPTGTGGEGNALFRIGGGGSLRINGGEIRVASAVETIFYLDKTRDLIVEGTEIRTGLAKHLVANRYAHTGTKPYPPLVMRPSLISSIRPEGLNMYKQLGGQPVCSHRNALYDIGTTEYYGVAPMFDAAFLTASNANEVRIRERVNTD